MEDYSTVPAITSTLSSTSLTLIISQDATNGNRDRAVFDTGICVEFRFRGEIPVYEDAGKGLGVDFVRWVGVGEILKKAVHISDNIIRVRINA